MTHDIGALTLERPDHDWTRDGYQRPLILPDPSWKLSPGFSQKTMTPPRKWLDGNGQLLPERPYTRVTTYAEALQDSSALTKWRLQRALIGMGRRPDYATAAAALTVRDEDKPALNDLAEKCIEASGPNAADIGTALHAFTERIDRGEPIGFVPPEYVADLEAYRAAVEPLTWVQRECRMVCDALETAGTPDGIAYCEEPDPDGVTGQLRIVDLKTGNLDYTVGKFSTQLGIYAHSALYDPRDGGRTWLPDLNTRWALVLHMPAGAGSAELQWLNIEHGWAGAELAGPVRAWRSGSTRKALLRPLRPVPPRVQPADGSCRGRLVSGKDCTVRAKPNGLCGRHQDQAEPEQSATAPGLDVAPIMEAMRSSTPVGEPVDEPEPPATPQSVGSAVESGEFRELQQAIRESEDAAEPCDVRVVGENEDSSPMHWCATHDSGWPHELTPEQNGNPTPHTSMPTPETAQEAAEAAAVALMDQIRECRSASEIQLLWERTGDAWTPAVKGYASRHQQLLDRRPQLEREQAALTAAIGAAGSQAELTLLWREHGASEAWMPEHTEAAKQRAADLPSF